MYVNILLTLMGIHGLTEEHTDALKLSCDWFKKTEPRLEVGYYSVDYIHLNNEHVYAQCTDLVSLVQI